MDRLGRPEDNCDAKKNMYQLEVFQNQLVQLWKNIKSIMLQAMCMHISCVRTGLDNIWYNLLH